MGALLGIMVILLLISAVGFGIAGGIDKIQSNSADKIRDDFLVDIQNVCNKSGIKYQEPTGFKVPLGDNMGYKYDYVNEVAFDTSGKALEPALYWIDKSTNELCFVGRHDSFKVNINDIEMHTFDGEIKYVPVVKNTGKDVSISGALVGGVVAGSAGMIVGATKDRNHTETEVKEIDQRNVYVYFRDGDAVKTFHVTKSFFNDSFNFGDFIKRELPEKSDVYLQAHSTSEISTSAEEKGMEEQLIELKRLLDNGLITDEDYNAKKKTILNI